MYLAPGQVSTFLEHLPVASPRILGFFTTMVLGLLGFLHDGSVYLALELYSIILLYPVGYE